MICGRLQKSLGSALLALTLFAPQADAQVTVYDNFGAGHGGWDYNWGLGWTIAGPNLSSAQFGVEQAMGFTSTTSGAVSDIWVAIWYVPFDAGIDQVTIRLAANPNGLPPTPADVMEEWTISSFQDWTAWSPPHHLVGNGSSQLVAGQSYWLWAEGGDTTWAGWCMNENPAFTCPHTLRREGQGWLPIGNETASAFRVDVVEAGTPYCFGVSCPCSNDDANAGCENSTGSGALLSSSGTSSVGSDDLTFLVTSGTPNQFGLLFAGTTQIPGIPFGDGLRCVGGNIQRLGIQTMNGAGQASWGTGLASTFGWLAGDQLNFQLWYRDPSFSCGNGFSTSNAIAVSFMP